MQLESDDVVLVKREVVTPALDRIPYYPEYKLIFASQDIHEWNLTRFTSTPRDTSSRG